MPPQAREGVEPIAEADLLALGPAPAAIRDRHFDEAHISLPDQPGDLGRHFGTETKPVLGEVDPRQHFAFEEFVARRLVGQPQACQPVARPGQQPVAQRVPVPCAAALPAGSRGRAPFISLFRAWACRSARASSKAAIVMSGKPDSKRRARPGSQTPPTSSLTCASSAPTISGSPLGINLTRF